MLPWYWQGGPYGTRFFLFRTALRDRPKGPSTPNHQPPPTANRQPPPNANRQPPPTASGDQPPTANRQPLPTAINHQFPTTNRRQPPPTATNRQPPTANTWCARGLFWENCVTPTFFFPVKGRPVLLSNVHRKSLPHHRDPAVYRLDCQALGMSSGQTNGAGPIRILSLPFPLPFMRETNARCARCYARCARGAHGLARVVLLTHHFFI